MRKQLLVLITTVSLFISTNAQRKEWITDPTETLGQEIPSVDEMMRRASQPGQPGVRSSRSASSSSSSGPLTMEEAFSFGEQVSRATNPNYGTGFTEPLRTPENNAKKYADEEFGFHPAVDNEAFYKEFKKTSVGSPGSDNPSYEELKKRDESNREKDIFLFGFIIFLLVFYFYQKNRKD